MPTFYKAVIQQSASGQEVNNILYYAPQVPTEMSFDVAEATALGQAIADAWAAAVAGTIAASWSMQGVEMSMIDENGATVSPFVVSVPKTAVGNAGAPASTAAQVLIYKFNCEFVSEAPGHSVPRRSYLAIGPIPEANIDPDGSITNAAAWEGALDAALLDGHLVSLVDFVPYRVGRTPEPTLAEPNPTPAGVGRVVNGLVRPFSSFRKSRMRRPSGS